MSCQPEMSAYVCDKHNCKITFDREVKDVVCVADSSDAQCSLSFGSVTPNYGGQSNRSAVSSPVTYQTQFSSYFDVPVNGGSSRNSPSREFPRMPCD